MEPKFQTSFIPKQSLQTAPKGPALTGYVTRRTVHGPGYYSTFVLFGVALLAALGIFAYTKYVERAINTKVEQIKVAREALEPSTLKEIARLDQRVESALFVVDRHVAPSALLELLKQVTLQKVKYDSARFERLAENAGTTLSLTGRSTGFEQIALQSDEYKKNEYMRMVTLSNLNVNDKGQALFSALIDLDPRLTQFSRIAGTYTGKGVSVQQATSTKSSTSTSTAATSSATTPKAPAATSTQSTTTAPARNP